MLTTRRRFLGDATRVSVAAAATSSLGFLGGFRPSSFAEGVRIFFIGAWVFRKDPRPLAHGLIAITRDMDHSDMSPMHTFPYGPWPDDDDFSHAPCLEPNPSATPETAQPHPVVVTGSYSKFNSVNECFEDARTRCTFNYFLPNPKKGDLTAVLTNPSTRVVSVPLPTRMITANFIKGSYFENFDHDHNCKGFETASRGHGSHTGASAHIFEYRGSKLELLFNGKPGVSSSSNHKGDFHFHTQPTGEITPAHPILMFESLLKLTQGFDRSKIALDIPDLNAKVEAGPHIPRSVSDRELALGKPMSDKTSADDATADETNSGHRLLVLAKTASCASAGHGVAEP